MFNCTSVLFAASLGLLPAALVAADPDGKLAECDTDLVVPRGERRHQAAEIQTQAKKLIADTRFQEAIAELEKLLGFETREYAQVRESAKLWIDRVRRRHERYLQQAYDAGKRMIAEGRFERARHLLEQLPADYRGTPKLLEELHKKRKGAEAALVDASRLYKEGKIEEAIPRFETAQRYWPHNEKLRKRVERARIKLGNRRLKLSYLKEARQARQSKDYDECLALCDRVLDLDPNDPTAAALINDVQKRVAAARAREARSRPPIELYRPHTEEEEAPRNPAVIIVAVSAVVLLALIFVLIFVILPQARHARETKAALIYRDAEGFEGEGRYAEAVRSCDRVIKLYPKTRSARKARDLIRTLEKTKQEAKALCDAIERELKEDRLDSLIESFDRYVQIAKKPPVSAVGEYLRHAEQRIEDLRGQIAQEYAVEAAAHEAAGRWHDALRAYRIAAQRFEFTDEPIGPGLEKAEKRVAAFEALLPKIRLFEKDGQWQKAAESCAAALDLVPVHEATTNALARIAPKLTPPEGMLLVPAGTYTVGGVEGHPRRTVAARIGFFIDSAEVTHARYADFVRKTGHSPPPGWTEEGAYPPGTGDLPVVNVTWKDAAAFAKWAGRSLPSEAEWESAARGTSGRLYAWGGTWQPHAVLGFGPAPAGSAPKDRSAVGCMDMTGNVAEWTATLLAPPPAPKADAPPPSHAGDPGLRRRATTVHKPPASRARVPRYIVKGSSWAGIESGRPSVVVSGARRVNPMDRAATFGIRNETEGGQRVLTPLPGAQEVSATHASDIALGYVGTFGTADQAYVLVRKWLPQPRAWVSARFLVKMGEPIGGEAGITLVKKKGDDKIPRVKVDFTTGCTAVKQEMRKWLDIRDPSGAVRRLAHERYERPKPFNLRFGLDGPPPESPLAIRDTAQAAARMSGRVDGRYLNVGFRCIKHLWAPPAKPAPKAPEPAEPTEPANTAGRPAGQPSAPAGNPVLPTRKPDTRTRRPSAPAGNPGVPMDRAPSDK